MHLHLYDGTLHLKGKPQKHNRASLMCVSGQWWWWWGGGEPAALLGDVGGGESHLQKVKETAAVLTEDTASVFTDLLSFSLTQGKSLKRTNSWQPRLTWNWGKFRLNQVVTSFSNRQMPNSFHNWFNVCHFSCKMAVIFFFVTSQYGDPMLFCFNIIMKFDFGVTQDMCGRHHGCCVTDLSNIRKWCMKCLFLSTPWLMLNNNNRW